MIAHIVRRRLLVAIAACGIAGAGLLGVAPREALAAWSADLIIDISGDGTGRVTSDDGAIDCVLTSGAKSGDCSEHYILPDFLDEYAVLVTLTPAASSIACSDSCSGDTITRQVKFFSNGERQTVLASFNLRAYRVEVAIDGPGSISSGGTACTPQAPWDYCRLFKHGTRVTLTAVPDAGEVFSYWSGSPCAGFDPVCTFTVTSDTTFGAQFGKVSISLDVAGSGVACATSGGTLCTEGLIPPVSNWIRVGNTLVIGTTPSSGWRFDHWNSGPCGGQGSTCSFTVTTAKSLVVTFTRIVTATPKPTPRPTPTPKPTPKPTPRPTPTATSRLAGTPIPAPTGAPAATDPATLDPGAMSHGPSAEPTAEVPVATTGSTTTGSPGASHAATPAASAAVVAAGDSTTGGDGSLLLLLGVVALLVALAGGFLLGRAGRASRAAPTPPRA